jgi:conjugal transfer pilus assembly protein TraD
LSENKKENSGGLVILAIMLFGIIGYQVWQKIKWPLLDWYFEHRLQLALVISGLILWTGIKVKSLVTKRLRNRKQEKSITDGKGEDSVYAGLDDTGEEIFIKSSYRTMHTQVVGTTNAGKTESVIVPWAVDDMKKKRGFILIDGKSDLSLLNKLYAYVKRYDRGKDFKVLSLSDPDISSSYNPLTGGSPLEITERVFGAFEFEDPYYKNLQFDYLKNVLEIFDDANETPTFLKLSLAIGDIKYLDVLAKKTKNTNLQSWVKAQESVDAAKRELRLSGLLTQINHFTTGQFLNLFNQENPSISIRKAMEEGQIIYFQLPAMRAQFLGKATAKLALQDLQYAVSERHLSPDGEKKKFFAVYLDDFSEYLTEGFTTMLNKSRSAKVGVTFAHQSLGDIQKLGEDVQNVILTNSNLKIIMRTNEPDSAEYFARVIGTRETTKMTERVVKNKLLGDQGTGDASARVAEEFRVHPGIIKNELGTGEAIVLLPHPKGSKHVRVQFQMLPDLPEKHIPLVNHPKPVGLTIVASFEEKKTTDTQKTQQVTAAQVLGSVPPDKELGGAQ